MVHEMNSNSGGFMQGIKDELTAMKVPWTDPKGNGNILIQTNGTNVQIYSSPKDGVGGSGRSVQVSITGRGLSGTELSNRYTQDQGFGALYRAPRAQGSPRTLIMLRFPSRLPPPVQRGSQGEE
jgi:hypothetical protein